ncbi:archaeal proteasome endopeptidase complex subunit beta [Candidatus Bathyarchaeota archaeon]|nr:archaeal proteasome endopeptidase complex subunit beta [Candidatus Bathyarchaeota archaeon]
MINDASIKLLQNNNVLKGTTTIGVVCKDGIILATDTRATMGYFIAHKKAKKVYKIDDHIAMTIAGAVADAQTVVEILKVNSKLYKYERGEPIPVNAAARLVANILFSSRYLPLMLQAIVGGVSNGKSQLFALDPLGSLTEEKYVSTGSGSPIAYGVLETEFKENMSVKEALPVVLKAIKSAIKRDAASGDDFDVALITLDGGYRELNKKEKEELFKN